MPELPEVEIVRSGLNRLIIGLEVENIWSDWPKNFPNSEGDVNNFLINSKINAVGRRGKSLIIDLNTNYSLITHLKMTGQLVFEGKEHFGAGHPSSSLLGPLPDKSTRVVISFKDGAKLFFNDQRKFGWMKLVPTSEVKNNEFIKGLGPEVLSDDFGSQNFIRHMRSRPNSQIKAVLLDQKVIAGVGNIYSDESLWMAKIHPASIVKDISEKKLDNLFNSLVEVMRESIKKGGSTDRNFVDFEGKKGSYLNFAKVFRREGQACPRCGREIKKIRVAGRGTHICEYCQRISVK